VICGLIKKIKIENCSIYVHIYPLNSFFRFNFDYGYETLPTENAISPVARPGSPFIALDTLISSGFDSSPWGRVRFPTWAEKILNLNGPRSENRQWGDICPNASGDEWNSLLSATLR